jgi:signal transduction histidine kinase
MAGNRGGATKCSTRRGFRRSAEALLTIIDDNLDFSKVEAGKPEVEAVSFDLRLAIEKWMRY